jgi:hypothetical protein
MATRRIIIGLIGALHALGSEAWAQGAGGQATPEMSPVVKAGMIVAIILLVGAIFAYHALTERKRGGGPR